MNHPFTSQFLVSSKNKEGAPRLRISVPIDDYRFITYLKDVTFLRRMTLTRPTGEVVVLDYPRISKGTTYGNYTPHFISISADDVAKYGFKPKEPVHVVVEWDD